MKVSIVGTGRIGSGLAQAWRRAGHEVTLGARDPSRSELNSFAESIRARVVEISEAGRNVDVITLAVPHTAVDEVVFNLGPLDGQIVIDCTNAVGPGLRLEFDHTTSAAEELQSQIPNAQVFKSFNAQGAENIANATYDGVRATNFYCGNDANARSSVERLINDAGFEPAYIGTLDKARLVESLMLLWVAVAREQGTRSIAFKLLQR